MTSKFNIPFYVKVSQILLALVAFLFILYIGQEIILPILFAGIVAILLNPIVNYLYERKVNRVIAIIIAILVAAFILFGISYFLSSQFAAFGNEFPKFKNKFSELFNQLTEWVSQTFNVSKPKIIDWVEN